MTDFERTHALALAEEDAAVMQQWRDLKQQLQDYADQIALVEAGLAEIDRVIDESLGAVRGEVQEQIDALFLRELPPMIAALEAVVERNNRLHQIENCSARLLQTGKLYCFNEGLDAWLYGLNRKLNLLSPK